MLPGNTSQIPLLNEADHASQAFPNIDTGIQIPGVSFSPVLHALLALGLRIHVIVGYPSGRSPQRETKRTAHRKQKENQSQGAVRLGRGLNISCICGGRVRQVGERCSDNSVVSGGNKTLQATYGVSRQVHFYLNKKFWIIEIIIVNFKYNSMIIIFL